MQHLALLLDEEVCTQLLRCQYLYFCTSKASKLSTCHELGDFVLVAVVGTPPRVGRVEHCPHQLPHGHCGPQLNQIYVAESAEREREGARAREGERERERERERNRERVCEREDATGMRFSYGVYY
jgi:hypothetical protein